MFTLHVRKLFRKTLVFWSTTPQQPKRPPTRLALEVLEDRTLLSVTSLPVASSPAESPLAVATSYMLALVEQRVQQFATIVQYASNVVNTLNWEIVQEVAALQLQVGHILGFDTNTPNLASNAAASQSSSDRSAGQNHASDSGSGSGTATTAHDNTHPRLEDAVPLADSSSGSGSGAGAYSGSATVYGPVWLDNNADGSQDQANEEMDYSGATVDLLRSTDNGVSWSVIDSTTTTSGLKYGNNYLLHAGFPVPVPNNWFYKVQVVFPPYCAATTPSAQSDINAQGYSQVFSLAPGAGQFIPAGLVSMNVNTIADDPNGPLQQNTVTLRDAMLTGNNLKPFPAVTFYTNPQTGQQLSGSIGLQKALPSIQKSYNITGPGATTLTVNGNNNAGTIFTVNAGVGSLIEGLQIEGGSGNNGGGIYNAGNLTLEGDHISFNEATGAGGGIFNATSAQLVLNGVNIYYNQATDRGGGLFINPYGNVTIYSGQVFNNTSAGGGGGIFNLKSTIAVYQDALIAQNSAANGGGLANWGGKFQMYGGTIWDNSVLQNGGGVSNGSGTMTLSGVAIQANGAGGRGGGIFVSGGTLTLTNNVTISADANGKGNIAASRGGGMAVRGC